MTTHENIGTPVQAIEFALKIDDHYDMRDFLGSWNEGDLTDWPEFLEHINLQPVDPAWMVEVVREGCAQYLEEIGDETSNAAYYRKGEYDRSTAYLSCIKALRLALSRGHVVLAPVMPSEDFVSEDDPLFNPIWDVIKGWDIGDRAKYGGYCGATGDHVRSIIRAVRSAAPVMPSEEEMLRGAREDAALANEADGNPHWATRQRMGNCDDIEVRAALQARRNVYASLGAVAGKAVSSGPVGPEVDLRSVLTKAWEAGWNSTRAALCQMFYDADKVKSLYEEMRRDDVSAILENLKSGEA
ncbi:hypothetical protein [Methylobacterium aquaticum]|uniref:hypothetical protein n=1 Tax=Methylobacterium aquaticum TaxID=270351 RepID=UPI001933AC08|nr:hypothetical protein [Methylobacterium aquaticum]QRE77356.1 hypothetical protein F1D61_30950 [Methylobacterium aquaticum]